MDFRHQATTLEGLAGAAVDALLLVVVGEALDPALDPALGKVLKDAIEHGDLALKKGKTLYLHRPAGVRAARVAVAVAADGSPKAVKAAAAPSLPASSSRASMRTVPPITARRPCSRPSRRSSGRPTS